MTSQQDAIYIGVSIAAAVISVAATYVNYRILKESRKQRKATYRPEVLPSNISIAFYTQLYNRIYLPFVYSSKEMKEFGTDDGMSEPIVLKLLNVGFAVAKNFEYVWSYDIFKFLDLLNAVKSTDFFKIEYKGGDHNSDSLTISIPEHGYLHFYTSTNQGRISEIGFILPSTEYPAHIIVPRAYIDLFNILMCIRLGYYNAGKRPPVGTRFELRLDDVPPLLLKISYTDLDDAVTTKTFRFQFGFYGSSDPSSHNEQYRLLGRYALLPAEIK
jgi:hypothetical protein